MKKKMAAQEVDPHDYFTHPIDARFECLVNEIVLSTYGNLNDTYAWDKAIETKSRKKQLREKLGKDEYTIVRKKFAIYNAMLQGGTMNMDQYQREIDEITVKFIDPN